MSKWQWIVYLSVIGTLGFLGWLGMMYLVGRWFGW